MIDPLPALDMQVDGNDSFAFETRDIVPYEDKISQNSSSLRLTGYQSTSNAQVVNLVISRELRTWTI